MLCRHRGENDEGKSGRCSYAVAMACVKQMHEWSAFAQRCTVFVFVSAGLFQLVSPNYGSLVRYRVVHWFFICWFVIEQILSVIKKPSDTISVSKGL